MLGQTIEWHAGDQTFKIGAENGMIPHPLALQVGLQAAVGQAVAAAAQAVAQVLAPVVVTQVPVGTADNMKPQLLSLISKESSSAASLQCSFTSTRVRWFIMHRCTTYMFTRLAC